MERRIAFSFLVLTTEGFPRHLSTRHQCQRYRQQSLVASHRLSQEGRWRVQVGRQTRVDRSLSGNTPWTVADGPTTSSGSSPTKVSVVTLGAFRSQYLIAPPELFWCEDGRLIWSGRCTPYLFQDALRCVPTVVHDATYFKADDRDCGARTARRVHPWTRPIADV